MKVSDQFYINAGWGKHLLLTWWCHQMETFSALLAICVGNSPVPGEFPTQRPVTRSFDVFFDLHLNKRLSKQPWGWWFETLSCPLWPHRNEVIIVLLKSGLMVEGDGHVCIICCQNICSHHVGSFKIKKSCHARDLKNWLGLVNKCIYYAHQTNEGYQVLPDSVGFSGRDSTKFWQRCATREHEHQYSPIPSNGDEGPYNTHV